MGKMMKNIQLFDCFTAKIMAELYVQFPVKKDFNTRDDFLKEDCVKNRELTKDVVDDVLHGTFVFLEENGLVTFDKTKAWEQGFFYDTGLTLKGLQLLNKEPKSIKERETIGDTLVKKIKEKGLDNAIDVIEKGLWGLMA